jgi:hypothetical protein
LNLPINLFDFLLLAVLIAGVLRGRKHGLSAELLSSVKWLALLLVCAAVYAPAGAALAEAGSFDLLSAYLLTYLGAALAIFLIFSIIERRLGPKLSGSDIFGRAEYYLGMGSGVVRFACMLLMMLALLNARGFSPGELKSMDKFQVDNYGSDLFPSLHSLQVEVFDKSLSGKLIKNDLGFLLIAQTETNHRDIPPARTASK